MRISSSIFHNVQYYETDAMRVAHHSNYVKWMEEARLNFFKQAGFDWKAMERDKGIMIPVLYQSVEYKQMLHFDDVIEITCICDKFNGVKMNFSYVFRSGSAGDIIHAIGKTKHGFIDANYAPVFLCEAYKEGFSILNSYINP